MIMKISYKYTLVHSLVLSPPLRPLDSLPISTTNSRPCTKPSESSSTYRRGRHWRRSAAWNTLDFLSSLVRALPPSWQDPPSKPIGKAHSTHPLHSFEIESLIGAEMRLLSSKLSEPSFSDLLAIPIVLSQYPGPSTHPAYQYIIQVHEPTETSCVCSALRRGQPSTEFDSKTLQCANRVGGSFRMPGS
jgi:hypothetical protein